MIMMRAAMTGVSTHVLRYLLGHMITAMADRYARGVGNPVRDARQRVGNAMADMMNVDAAVSSQMSNGA